ncbi:MAG TPA: hypothetical protein VK177_01285 [Flavobacteriales bacterium]|nr:hypothetical protein [Flavobacteriales bacterium]
MEAFEKSEMSTLVSCTNRLQKEGYKENFVARDRGLEAPSTNKVYTPADVKINNFFRFEGESDPADNSILYAIETTDGLKGMLIDAYGAYANPKVSKFITEVEDIIKKEHTDKKSN